MYLLPLFLFTLLFGCAGQQQVSNQLAYSLNSNPPEIILTKLSKIKPVKRDIVQYQLNIGLLQLLSGKFKASIETLTSAKKEMQLVQASSISENFAAGSVSEVLRSYSGSKTDLVMVHNILALSYLFNDDIDNARVEMLQADVSMKELANNEALSGQLASTHLLSAIIYELLDEQSNALISYRDVSDVMQKNGIALPVALKKALLRMSYKLGATAQYRAYKKQFPKVHITKKDKEGQIFILYFDGVVSAKKETAIMVPNYNADHLIRIALPTYPRLDNASTQVKLSFKNTEENTQIIENENCLARADLKADLPAMLVATTTRAVLKYKLVSKANESSPALGILANLAAVLSEVADLRSWNMLPANIQFAYIEGSGESLHIQYSNRKTQTIKIKKGSYNLFLINSLSDHIYHYQS